MDLEANLVRVLGSEAEHPWPSEIAHEPARASAVTGNVEGSRPPLSLRGSRILEGMAERVSAREISNEEGRRLLRLVRRDSGSMVRWRRAQMVLLSA